MGKHNFKLALFIFISIMALSVATQTANAALTLENVKAWYWSSDTEVLGVATGDVDGDGSVEVVTAGYYYPSGHVAQLCVWSGGTLGLEMVRTWEMAGGHTDIQSVAIGNVDNDNDVEIVTGGYCWDGTQQFAQLGVLSGKTLALENSKVWLWANGTLIDSVAAGDVDDDMKGEIVTGGHYYDDKYSDYAQLCVWDGATLSLEKVQAWQRASIYSVAIGDVDANGKMEVVTGGYGGGGDNAQLCVWYGATLALKNVRTWYWTSTTLINSVAIGDADGDGNVEIATGGTYNDYAHTVAQLCVWSGATLALKRVQTWYWGVSFTRISSIKVGNVDGDSSNEVVTGGWFNDGTRGVAQLCVWNGATPALKSVQTWYWTSHTWIWSVAFGDLDADAKVEIVTGGYYNDGTRKRAQLTVWS